MLILATRRQPAGPALPPPARPCGTGRRRHRISQHGWRRSYLRETRIGDDRVLPAVLSYIVRRRSFSPAEDFSGARGWRAGAGQHHGNRLIQSLTVAGVFLYVRGFVHSGDRKTWVRAAQRGRWTCTCPMEQTFPAAILIHGGGQKAAEHNVRPLFDLLTAQGSRGSASLPGGSARGQMKTVVSAIRWLKANAATCHVDATKIA